MKNYKVEVPIPSVSDALFDSKIKKPTEAPTPDENPEMESINQELRRKWHEEHPTIGDLIEPAKDLFTNHPEPIKEIYRAFDWALSEEQFKYLIAERLKGREPSDEEIKNLGKVE